MSFNYKNPLTPLTSLGNLSVQRQNVFGTNFSILSTGGYMEVYNLNELYYTIPSGNTGLIEYTGNTIPIQLNKGTGSPFSFDVLTLNSDNISSGRRRLGMLVYVIDQDETYQYQIPNFISLWNSATGATGPGGPTVIFSDFGTTIKSNTPQGVAFISAWTANTIEGISGETSSTAVWKKFSTNGLMSGDYLPLSGGTVTGDTIFTSGVTANTFSASTYLGLPGDIFITGGTFDDNTGTLILDRSSGSSITITGFTDYYTTAFTYNDNTFTIFDNSGNTFPVTVNDFTGLTINGTLSASTFTGGTFYGDGSGLTNLIYTGGTISGNTVILSGLTATTISASTYLGLPIDIYVTGGTYSAGTATFTNNTGGTFDVSGFTTPFTGNTSGDCITDLFVSNINSCSPLHIQPINLGDVYIGENGGVNVGIGTSSPSEKIEVVGKTKTTNFQMTSGATNGYILTSDSLGNASWSPLSGASGYSDTYVTGGTYSAGTATFTNNTGGTFNVTGFSDFHYYISGSSPSGVTLSIGDRWYNTNNGAEYVWNYDGNTYQWVQPAGTPGPQGIQGVSGATGPQGPQGVPGYSNLLVTTAITISAETLTTGYTYYGIVHTGIVNLTLPNPTGIDGFNLNIKDESGNAGIYRIRLTSPIGNIDNDNYVDMNINKMSLNLVARNNNWWII